MKRFAGFLAMLCLLPAALVAQDENPILNSPNEPHATLDFRASPTAGALMVVRPVQIGSRNVGSQTADRRTWWIRPGEYEFKFTAMGSPSSGSGTVGRGRRSSRQSSSTITATVDAGLLYNVAGVGLSDGTWTPVVWRITDEESGEVLFDLIEEITKMKEEEKADE